MAPVVGAIEVIQTETRRAESPLNPCHTVLAKGYRVAEDRRAFDADTIFERDVAIPMRDGIFLRADIFRPAKSKNGTAEEKVPVLIAWGPYGKESGRGPMDFFDLLPGRMGIPKSQLSGFQTFEAPDPAQWVGYGYAICNVDIRGIGNSEGDLNLWGSADGRDGYDTIEYLASLPWCNGSVAFVGNSWLAMSQWFIAAEQPPHLKCIAPLEGASDIYRETIARGGVPAEAFHRFISSDLRGRGQMEDLIAMLNRYPTWNEYWEDKRAKMERINVPAYILASFSTGVHTVGSFRAYEEIQSRKWLRVHATQEWFDLYGAQCTAELKSFFDRYTKDIRNGWEKTPQVRLSILQYNKAPITNLVIPDWPLPSTKYQTLYLNGSSHLVPEMPVPQGNFRYQSDVKAMQADDDSEEIRFEHTFSQKTYMVGYPKVTLFASCPDHNDMDIYVQLRKADIHGNILQSLNIPEEALELPVQDIPSVNPVKYLGPTGILRASHRDISQKLSKENRPIPGHQHVKLITPGTITKLEIGLWPTAIAFEKGEKLVLKISGHHMILAEFEPLRGTFTSGNRGRHLIHFGGETGSSLDIPLVDIDGI